MVLTMEVRVLLSFVVCIVQLSTCATKMLTVLSVGYG